jgi:hypothetical protein
MNRLARTVTLGSTLSLVLLLSNCSSFDPTDIMDNLFASQKKPLPGERKPLFPAGTPGVAQGLPPELVKGYQPPPVDQTAEDTAAASEKPKPKPKPKPKVAAAPPANPASPPAAVTASPAAMRPSVSQSSPWPDPPPSRQSAAPAGQTAWPDPPAPTVTR